MFNITLLDLFLRIPAAFLALVLHEMVKARCSTMLGDPSPKNSGLMSGNPFKYLEPIGFIITVFFGFGWGRPTPTSPMYYKDIKKGIVITYLTPSLVNLASGLLVAVLAGSLNAVIFLLLPLLADNPYMFAAVRWLIFFLHSFALVSVSIALFNMIPVPPLDAAKLLQTAISPNAAIKLAQNEKVLQIVLLLLMVMGVIGGVIMPISRQLVGAALAW